MIGSPCPRPASRCGTNRALRAGMQTGARSIGSWDGAISHHWPPTRRAARMLFYACSSK
jgi:hypothetical protein